MFPKILEQFYDRLEKYLKGSDILPGKSGRHMKYPYTFTAKIAQFPLFYYMKKNWMWMYYPPGVIIGLYLISYIHVLVNSEENKRNWAETQRRMAEAEAHH